MAENDDSQSKTEEPTQKRIDKSREEGQILRSQDFAIAVSLFGLGALIVLISSTLIEQVTTLFTYNFMLDARVTRDPGVMLEKIVGSAEIMLPLVGLICLLSVLGVILANGAFGGISFSLKAAAPKLSKLNPLAGLKRMFGGNALFELAKNIFKTLFLGSIVAFVIYFYMDALGMLGVLPASLALGEAGRILAGAVLFITLSLFLIALVDMPWQHFQHMKKMRMSLQEIKDEMKESEGRPEVKAQQRKRQHDIAFNRMMSALETADVVITNPTHFAVALSYTPGTSDAPRVVAKGADMLALRIREKALEHQVPLFEAPELARALYFTTRLDDMIPEALYHTVAEVIAYIFNVGTAMKMGQRLKRPVPVVPDTLRFNENGDIQADAKQ
jgi:flagellar biosynthetic protein FlhB